MIKKYTDLQFTKSLKCDNVYKLCLGLPEACSKAEI